MKIEISVPGRFHSFSFAKFLQDRDLLARIVTAYPKFLTRRFSLKDELVASVFTKEILQRSIQAAYEKLPLFLRNKFNTQIYINNIYDKLASFKLVETDIFLGFASACLYQLRRNKEKGLSRINAIDQVNSHPVFFKSIMEEEYSTHGIKMAFDQRVIDKMLLEYDLVDYIFTPSLFVKQSFIEAGVDENKLVNTPYGVDLSAFRQAEKRDDVFRLIYAGNLSIRKGVPYLLKAWKELNLKNAELLFMGSVSEDVKPFLDKYVGSYRLVGHVPQTEMYRYFSDSSVFILPSVEDGFGLVISQAMACGLPIIATTNTGGPDLVDNGKEGFIIPIRSVDAIKEGVMYFYDNPEKRDEMGRAAKIRVSSGFTWDDYGNRIVAEYERILKEIQ